MNEMIGDNKSTVKVFACQNKDKDILKNSSSGGAFYELAKNVIDQNGVVFGARFNEDFQVELGYTENVSGIREFMTSKYVQSSAKNSYSAAKEFLEQGRLVLFSGSPCQIHGLLNFLSKDYDNLLTVEFICHGMPKKQIWEQYLQTISGERKIKSINFRDKTEGWNLYSLSIQYTDGSVYRKNLHEDLYLRGFLADLFLMSSCYQCQYKGTQRAADVTLGDLWGAEQFGNLPMEQQIGISCVWLHTEKARKQWEYIQRYMDYQLVDENEVVKYNPAYMKSVEKTDISDIFEELLNYDIPLMDTLKLCVEASEFYRENPWMKKNGVVEYFSVLKQNNDIMEAARTALYGKHKIGIVGPWSNKNHGGVFTYYALYQAVKDMGYIPLMIAQPEDSYIHPEVEKCGYQELPYAEYEMAPVVKSVSELKMLNNLCDTFLVGSDQWYNQALAYGIQEYTNLSWVYSTKNKAAYAASFGYDDYYGTEYQRGALANYLQRFDKFTVRELSGEKLCKEKFGVDAECVLDPVFLCPKSKYELLAAKGTKVVPKKPYIFSYVMDLDGQKNTVLSECSKEMNMPVRAAVDFAYNSGDMIPDWSIDTVYGVSHEEWLSLIENSSYMITDSYHGLCFALIYHKPFVALVNERRGKARFDTLIKFLGLEDCVVETVNDISKQMKCAMQIDWSRIDELLEQKKLMSMEILRQILELEPKAKKELSDFDLLNGSDSMLDGLKRRLEEVDYNYFNATQQLFASHQRAEEKIDRIDKLFWEQIQQLFALVEQGRQENEELKKQIDEIQHRGIWKFKRNRE